MADRPVVWCISASDSSGGAGLQADNAACRAFGTHPCHVVTGVTAQSSVELVHVHPLPGAAVSAQLTVLATDLPPAAVKIGAIPGADAAAALARIGSVGCPVVVDPVLGTSTGGRLAFAGYREFLLDELLPQTTLLTPNLAECAALTGRPVRCADDMAEAADWLLARGAQAVIVKGGHLEHACAIDFYADRQTRFWLRTPRVRTPHDHGTGCTFASAAAAALASGEALPDAVVLAKMYVHEALTRGYRAGAGAGPVGHGRPPSSPWAVPTLHYDRPPAELPPAFPSCDTNRLGLYACVDSAAWIERLLGHGVRTLQLRNKTLTGGALTREIRRAHELCTRAGARLFVNDHWRIAAEIGAYGVHLGQEDLDGADVPALRAAGVRLGISTHAWYELARAHGVRPSYLAFGPIYPTTTKAMKFRPQGLERLRRWARITRDYPQVAIGGIDASRVRDVMAQGVGSVCVVRAITEADDVGAAVDRLQAEVTAAR